MAKVKTTITLDEEVKKEAQELFSELGLDLSTAVNMFLHQSVRIGGFPFEVTRKVPNEATLAAIKEAEENKLHGPVSSAKELMNELDKDD